MKMGKKYTYEISFLAKVRMNFTIELEADSLEQADKTAKEILHNNVVNYESDEGNVRSSVDYDSGITQLGKATLTRDNCCIDSADPE